MPFGVSPHLSLPFNYKNTEGVQRPLKKLTAPLWNLRFCKCFKKNKKMTTKSEVAALVSESKRKQYAKIAKKENNATFSQMIAETVKIVNSNSIEGEELTDAELMQHLSI